MSRPIFLKTKENLDVNELDLDRSQNFKFGNEFQAEVLKLTAEFTNYFFQEPKSPSFTVFFEELCIWMVSSGQWVMRSRSIFNLMWF